MTLSVVFLLAATRVLAAAEHAANSEKDYIAGKLIVFNDNGGWCWY